MTNTTQTYDAVISRVVDGDTVYAVITHQFFDTTLTKEIEVRMVGIDAPEKSGVEKNRGVISKNWLTNRVEKKKVQVEVGEKDVYGRYLCTIFHSGDNINELMLEQKLAEVYTPENHNNGVFDE